MYLAATLSEQLYRTDNKVWPDVICNIYHDIDSDCFQCFRRHIGCRLIIDLIKFGKLHYRWKFKVLGTEKIASSNKWFRIPAETRTAFFHPSKRTAFCEKDHRVKDFACFVKIWFPAKSLPNHKLYFKLNPCQLMAKAESSQFIALHFHFRKVWCVSDHRAHKFLLE